VQVLTGTNTYGGATNISGGVLRISAAPVVNPVTAGLLYQLDAASGGGFTLSGSTVTQFNDLSGNGNPFVAGVIGGTAALAGPTVLSGASGMNGLSVLHFNGANQLVLNNSTVPETVFIVNRVTSSVANDDGIWGQIGDFGVRDNGGDAWLYASGNRNDYVVPARGSMYINGLQVSSTADGSYTLDSAQLVDASNASPGVFTQTGLGAYFGGNGRPINADIGEVLAFSTTLSTSQRQAVEEYLMNKWEGVQAGYAANGVLPSTTPVNISSGGTFDMSNGTQTIASLSSTDGQGSQVLLGASGLLTIGGTASTTFDGTISGSGGGLVKNGTGTLLLTGTPVSGIPTATSSFGGGVTVNNGTLEVAAVATTGGDTVLGLASTSSTINVNAGGTLLFVAPNALGTAFNSTNLPTLNINGGTVTNADPASTGKINSALNNVVLTNGLLTATTGQHGGYAAWNINGTITSSGNSLISTSDPVYGTVMLDSVAPYNTSINVQNGVLTVSAPLVQDNPDSIVSGLTKTGSGTLLLTASNGYAGGTTVHAGVLQVGNVAALGSGALAANGGTLDLAGFSVTVPSFSGAAGFVGNSGGALATLAVSQTGSTLFGGTIEDGVSKTAFDLTSGTLTLTGTNTYTGGTTVAGGTLILSDNEALADGSSLTVGDASAFAAPVAPSPNTGVASAAAVAPVPEPGTLALLTALAGGVAAYRRLRRRANASRSA
jgi:autotransporter-associated beta strand protein